MFFDANLYISLRASIPNLKFCHSTFLSEVIAFKCVEFEVDLLYNNSNIHVHVYHIYHIVSSPREVDEGCLVMWGSPDPPQ